MSEQSNDAVAAQAYSIYYKILLLFIVFEGNQLIGKFLFNFFLETVQIVFCSLYIGVTQCLLDKLSAGT